MSVLFQAPSKAAQDYREQSDAHNSAKSEKSRTRPVSENRYGDESATSVPLWPQPTKSYQLNPTRNFYIAAFTGLTATVALFFCIWQQDPAVNPAPSVAVAVVPVPEKPVPFAKPPSTAMMLPAKKLDPGASDDEALTEMTRQLADMPFNPPDPAISPSHLAVDEPELALPGPAARAGEGGHSGRRLCRSSPSV